MAVTALSRPTDRERAIQEGADDYISKPFDLDLLVAVIERHVAGGGYVKRDAWNLEL